MAYENDQSELYNMLLHPNNPVDASHYTIGRGIFVVVNKVKHIFIIFVCT